MHESICENTLYSNTINPHILLLSWRPGNVSLLLCCLESGYAFMELRMIYTTMSTNPTTITMTMSMASQLMLLLQSCSVGPGKTIRRLYAVRNSVNN